ncbi:hypothetical protein LJC46_09115 [Desulfovibrio sp. OttesenSCG-928-G15]|nr:hypothetical protein [Desulfovibrio sp. OttesenSCG-928-G15]
MLIALHDSDDTNFPNLALMKIAAWHKHQGHEVVWYAPDEALRYDRVFSSKVFSWTPEDSSLLPWAVKSGTGYGLFHTLPDAVEHICPDYSIYQHVHERRNSRRKRPEPGYSLGFTTRGCVNSCAWCIVPQKEGQIRAHADVEEFCRHRHVVLLDNNALAHDHGITQIEKMIRLGLRVDFNQGLDARRIDGQVARRLAALGWFKPLRLACDQKSQMPVVEKAVRLLRAAGAKPKEYFCYVLVTDVDEAYERTMFLRGLGLAPFAQAYRDFSCNTEPTVKQRLYCRWVNHKALFKSILWPDYWEQERIRRRLAA